MLKDILKSIIRRTPYRVIRARDANRFSAIEECLQSLARRGYRPLRIVDGGANVGDFARCADRIFRPAAIHLVEPQPACRRSLASLARDHRYHLHAIALGADDTTLYLTIDPTGITTGAHIDLAPEPSAPPPPALQCKSNGLISYLMDASLIRIEPC